MSRMCLGQSLTWKLHAEALLRSHRLLPQLVASPWHEPGHVCVYRQVGHAVSQSGVGQVLRWQNASDSQFWKVQSSPPVCAILVHSQQKEARCPCTQPPSAFPQSGICRCRLWAWWLGLSRLWGLCFVVLRTPPPPWDKDRAVGALGMRAPSR